MTFFRCKQIARFALIAMVLSVTGLLAQEPGWVKHVPDADRTRTNPQATEPAAIDAGKKLYDEKCAHCHGASGEGKGHSPSLQTDAVHNLTPGELEWAIAHGFRFRMPGFGSLTQDQRWQIVSYVQSLPKAK